MEEVSMNKMGVMPVGKLMLNIGIPMILSMVLQAVYNIVDSAFVANMEGVGELALNALTLAFPIQLLMVAVGIGTGVGTNALLARRLGEGDMERVSRTAGNAVFLGIVITLLFVLFGIFGTRTYIASQTSNEMILEMGVDYLRICSVCSIGMVFYAIFEKLLQATGRSIFSTVAQVLGAVTNIVLDPILIFGLIGFPELGVKGAAYATVIGQIVSFVAAFIFHIKYNKEIKNNIKYIKPSLKTILEIYAIGLPAIIAQALTSVMTYGLNIIFVSISENVVTAYGLFYKIQQFILFAAFGLRDAITPIVAFNKGMKSKKRVKEGIKYGLTYTFIIMAAGLIVIEIFAEPFSALFGLSGETQGFCISAMRVISISFIFAGANIALQGVFQALDSGIESLVVSICRQLIFIIPVAWFFSIVAGKDNIGLVWSTFPLGEFLTFVIALLFMLNIKKKKIEVLN
ncbi:MAG: MATE family efflux transporter [Clostridia bacterium]|nr:MATE family efflux transporter [Clostridia bacterium]